MTGRTWSATITAATIMIMVMVVVTTITTVAITIIDRPIADGSPSVADPPSRGPAAGKDRQVWLATTARPTRRTLHVITGPDPVVHVFLAGFAPRRTLR